MSESILSAWLLGWPIFAAAFMLESCADPFGPYSKESWWVKLVAAVLTAAMWPVLLVQRLMR